MASKWWKESYCWEKLGNLDIGKALEVLKYCDKFTVDEFSKDLSRLSNETSINGEHLKSFVTRHKPIINLILCGGMPFDKNDEHIRTGTSSRYEHIRTKDSLLFSIGFHIQFCECFLLSVLGRQGAWRSSLKNVLLDGDSFCLSKDEVVACCANLSSNSNLRSLDLRNQELFRSTEGCRLLGQALRMNSTLERLFLPSTNLTSKGVEQLMYGLAGDSNTNLKVLDMGMNDRIGDSGIRHIAKMLVMNQTLKILHLRGTGCGFEGASLISSALLVNSSLELLSLGSNPLTVEGMEMLLAPLTPVVHTAGEYRMLLESNSTLKNLQLEYLDDMDFSVQSLRKMIKTNKTLETLSIKGVLIGERDWIHLVIPALHENNTLKYLAMSGSNVLPLDALVELIKSPSGNTKTLRAGVKNRQLRSGLKAQRTVRPKLERIILCGYKFSGKTTICETMRYLVDGPPAFHHCNVAWKKLRKKVIRVRKSLFGTQVLAKPEYQTRGCDVLRIRNEPHRKTYVWDFAGQKEYYALHKTLSSNFLNSCFLYVCSAVVHIQTCDQSGKQGRTRRRIKNQQDFQKELEYWIRYIVADSRPSVSGISEYADRPRFIFVLTNKDELDEVTLHYIIRSAEHAVAEMRERYHSIVDLQEIVTVVDSHSCQDVQELIRLAEESLEEVLQQSAESAACDHVRRVLEKWSVRNTSKPFLGMADFRTLCDEEVGANLDRHVISAAKLLSPEGQVTVLNHLNSLGDVIFPSSHDLIVVNPGSFGLDILGSIIQALKGARLQAGECEDALGFCGTCLNPADHEMGLYHEKGFVRERQIEEIADRLKHVSSTEFLNLLIHLELCFETTTGTANKYTRKVFVPAVFDDEEETAIMGRRQLKWTENIHRRDFYYVYIGRRLGCDASAHTVFTPGFFPRLQVCLHNYCMTRGWLGNQAFQMDRNLFGFYENGVEVLVEYSGAVGFFVDILVKSSRPFSYALDFIQVNLIQKIQQFCSSPEGCPGIVLLESVIRPLCVKDLHLCVDRINQTVPISSVHDRVEENGYNYKHAWPKSIPRVSDVEKAVELLGGEDCPLLKNSNSLVRAADNSVSSNAQISTLLVTSEDQDCPQPGSTAENTVERDLPELNPLEITSQPVLERRLQGDAQYEQKRPVTSTEQHLPSRFYPTYDDVGYLSSLWAKIEAKKAVKIHLMCESPSGSHYVPEQHGRNLNLRTGRSSVMEHILTFLRQGLAGTAQLAGMDVDAGWFHGVFGTSLNLPIKIEDLLRITDRCNPLAPISDDEILSSLSMYLKVERSAEWLRDFLNMENGNAFRHDFGLWKVKDLNTDSIAWVCVAHYMEALRQQNQVSIQP